MFIKQGAFFTVYRGTFSMHVGGNIHSKKTCLCFCGFKPKILRLGKGKPLTMHVVEI